MEAGLSLQPQNPLAVIVEINIVNEIHSALGKGLIIVAIIDVCHDVRECRMFQIVAILVLKSLILPATNMPGVGPTSCVLRALARRQEHCFECTGRWTRLCTVMGLASHPSAQHIMIVSTHTIRIR